jgi:hypothetical protein
MTAQFQLDLVLLVPGQDERQSFESLLSARRESLGIAQIQWDILVHPRKDAGVYCECIDVLRPVQRRARYALVVFDHEGSGQEMQPAHDVEQDLRARLANSGWGERAEVLVIQPELEIWIWSDSPEVDRALGWQGRTPGLREWLKSEGLWAANAAKPCNPRKCLLQALREVRKPYSSAVFRPIAEGVSLHRCKDQCFGRLKEILQRWFPVPVGGG